MAELPRRTVEPLVVHHPKSPNASAERVRELAGIISLAVHVPFRRPLDDEEEYEDDGTRMSERAGD